MFYESASFYAKLGWFGAGKLMGLSSYGRVSGRRFMSFDPGNARFQLDPMLGGTISTARDWDRLGEQWLEAFEASAFRG